MVESKDKLIEKAMADLNAHYKKEVIVKGATGQIDRISTGLVSVDKLTGGGIPRGRWTMIYGSKGVGKTSLCYKIIALVQENGGKVVYIDAEHAYEPNRAIALGVDVDSLIFVSPETLEESETAVRKFANLVDLIVVDSIVAVGSLQEMEDSKGNDRDLEKDTMALIPRKLSQFFRVVNPIVGKSTTAVILVNQTRMDLGAFIPIDKYPGGNALAHYASFILRMRRSSNKDWPTKEVIEDGKKKQEPIGKRIKLFAEKSKISSTENMETCMDLMDEFPHFDEYSDLMLAAEMDGLIVHSGAWYAITGSDKKYQGSDGMMEALRNDVALFNELKTKVMNKDIKIEPKVEVETEKENEKNGKGKRNVKSSK